MREIKFRGKRTDGDWVYGSLINEGRKIQCRQVLAANPPSRLVRAEFAIDPLTVGQFTGLLDKNGKDIYEGDHVGTCSNGYKWSVEWGSFGDAGYYAYNGLNSCRRLDVVYGDAVFTVCESQQIICEVIGNIHEVSA